MKWEYIAEFCIWSFICLFLAITYMSLSQFWHMSYIIISQLVGAIEIVILHKFLMEWLMGSEWIYT